MTKETVLEEIAALQKQAQEAVVNVHKIEGALQFAHHVLSLIEQREAEALAIASVEANK